MAWGALPAACCSGALAGAAPGLLGAWFPFWFWFQFGGEDLRGPPLQAGKLWQGSGSRLQWGFHWGSLLEPGALWFAWKGFREGN